MKKLPFILALVLLVSAVSVLGYGPRTHTQIWNEICADKSYSSPDKDLCCMQEPDACVFGMTSTDRDVFHYLSDFKKYQKDHSWATYSTCRQKAAESGSDREMAYCVGLGLHLTMDSISHNVMIPDQVMAWGAIQEPLAHVVSESGVDDKYPATDKQNALYFTPQNIQFFCKSSSSIATRSTGVQSTWECDALADAVSNGANYQSRYFIAGPIMNFAYQVFIKISGLFPLEPWEPHHQQSLALCKQTLQGNYPTTQFPDPTGYEALDIANIGYKIMITVVEIGLVIAILFFIIKAVFFRR